MVEENPIGVVTNQETNQIDHAQMRETTSQQSYPTPFRNRIEPCPRRSHSLPVQRPSAGFTTSATSPSSQDSFRTTEIDISDESSPQNSGLENESSTTPEPPSSTSTGSRGTSLSSRDSENGNSPRNAFIALPTIKEGVEPRVVVDGSYKIRNILFRSIQGYFNRLTLGRKIMLGLVVFILLAIIVVLITVPQKLENDLLSSPTTSTAPATFASETSIPSNTEPTQTMKTTVFTEPFTRENDLNATKTTLSTTTATRETILTTTKRTIPASMITYMFQTCRLNEAKINFIPGSCSDFFECNKSLPQSIKTCGAGTLFFFDFDQMDGYCNYENLVDCNDPRRQ